MVFNSLEYLIFLAVIVLVYYQFRNKYQWVVLLVCSYVFYMTWNVKHTLLLLLCTGITWGAGELISRTTRSSGRKVWLTLSIIANLFILGIYKYYNFFAESLSAVLNKLGLSVQIYTLSLLLPIGISFYIFRALSYTIDVYRGEIKATHNFGKYALFVSFFPELVSGPIEKPKHLIPQFDRIHDFDAQQVTAGLQLILWGYLKKIVIADRLAIVVDHVFRDVRSYSGQEIFIAAIFFSFQIYFDFSSYSDMAIGSGRVLGYDLKPNFNRPYLSKSIAEFWRRWHISLSTWFKDYIYIPLGGSRKGILKWGINICIVFLVSGLWHGAAWTFVIWGALHAILQLLEKPFMKIQVNAWVSRLMEPFLILFNFILASCCWIFFRADSVSDAVYMLYHMFPFHPDFTFTSMGTSAQEFIFSIIVICIFMILEWIQEYGKADLLTKFNHMPVVVRYAVYIFALMFLIMFGVYGSLSPESFIYQKF